MRLDLCFSFRLDVLRHFHFAVSHPTFRAGSIAVRRCWFLSCDHYGNLASFLLLIYDLVNMPACQMVLFFRLGDNEINKNCCKKQRGGGFFPWMGLSSFLQTCLGGPGPGLAGILSRWKAAKGSGHCLEVSDSLVEALPCAYPSPPSKTRWIRLSVHRTVCLGMATPLPHCTVTVFLSVDYAMNSLEPRIGAFPPSHHNA